MLGDKTKLLFASPGNKTGLALGSGFRHGLGQESRAVTLENGKAFLIPYCFTVRTLQLAAFLWSDDRGTLAFILIF